MTFDLWPASFGFRHAKRDPCFDVWRSHDREVRKRREWNSRMETVACGGDKGVYLSAAVSTADPFERKILKPSNGVSYWTKKEDQSGSINMPGRMDERLCKPSRTVILDPKYLCMFAAMSEEQGQIVYTFVKRRRSTAT
jgi:hypothetical protein